MSRGALQKLHMQSRYEKRTKVVFSTSSKKGSQSRSSRHEPKISLISFSRGSGPPLSSKIPLGIFPTRVGRVWALKAKVKWHCVQVKQSLISRVLHLCFGHKWNVTSGTWQVALVKLICHPILYILSIRSVSRYKQSRSDTGRVQKMGINKERDNKSFTHQRRRTSQWSCPLWVIYMFPESKIFLPNENLRSFNSD